VHKLTPEHWRQDDVDPMLEQHGAQLHVILDRHIHIGFKEIVFDLTGILKQKPAARPIDREYTDLLASGTDQRGDLLRRQLQKMFEGDHLLLEVREGNWENRSGCSGWPGTGFIGISSFFMARLAL
jgi:hypothetical protein